MSLTDLQAGLMLGFVGGFAFGGILGIVVYALSFRRTMRRLDTGGTSRNTSNSH